MASHSFLALIFFSVLNDFILVMTVIAVTLALYTKWKKKNNKKTPPPGLSLQAEKCDISKKGRLVLVC